MMETIFENRKAKYNYSILETYTCGIELYGDEVVSLRNRTCSITEAFCVINKGECFINNMYIKAPSNIMFRTADETRSRKLLLHKKEIIKLDEKVAQAGLTIVPLKIVKVKNLYKIIIALAKGKKLYDKRETIKERDINRDLAKQLKSY